MGLDLVELVMRLEEEFEIVIPDEVAGVLTTPREVIDWIAAHPKVSQEWSRGYVEVTVWLCIEDELGVRRDDYTDDSRFIHDMGAG
ncbi:MAG TPA: hypothetical protein VGO43_01530 [Pyrinomonadaceae bacterium]|jgi:hypothetical protein|nr:hypothetical protein [Pyrinomonadaceae bacterium]